MFLRKNSAETVCLLYHQKKEFISVPYEPKNADYLKIFPGNATYEEIKEFEPDATVLDGIAVSGSKAGSSDDEIDTWLAGLKY